MMIGKKFFERENLVFLGMYLLQEVDNKREVYYRTGCIVKPWGIGGLGDWGISSARFARRASCSKKLVLGFLEQDLAL